MGIEAKDGNPGMPNPKEFSQPFLRQVDPAFRENQA
jgi:hypothetical protein